MTKVAVVFADGFEEIEALSPVDVFRRAGFDCSMLGLESRVSQLLTHFQVQACYSQILLGGKHPLGSRLRFLQSLPQILLLLLS